MAISSEIEKLEKRWQQTSGLVFAPLAEAYRKAGLQARALEILEQGLALHAEYGPALIVRARCHLDTGDYGAAEGAFHQALGRDPTDPIALRGLADVFERTGRLPEAIERLRTLVDVDPRNSEAKVVLDRLLATPTEIPQAIAPEPVPEPVAEVAEPVRDQLDSLDFDVVNLSAVESLPAIPEQRIDTPIEEDFAIQSFDTQPLEAPEVIEPAGPILWTPAPAESVAEVAPALAVEPEPGAEPEIAPEPVLEEISLLEPEPVVEAEPAPEQQLEPVVVFEETVAEVVAPDAAEFNEPVESAESIPAADAVPVSEPVFDLVEATATEPVPVEVPELVEEPTVEEYASRVDSPAEFEAIEAAPEPEVIPEPVVAVVEVVEATLAADVSDVSDAADAHEAPTLIVTESMAELFLKQGHRELALAVYRQLADRSPESDSIRGAIARLEQELAPPPAAPAPERKPYAAAETGGRSVERRLQAVLHAPPPSTASTVLPPAIEPGAEPTRPSQDALSLSAVFGDEPAARPRREEEPAASTNAAEPSYDEFFGAGPTEPAAAPAPRGEGEADLRQFNEWLKGLKR
jgi:tetratricopeptide (TPR) repeat protein